MPKIKREAVRQRERAEAARRRRFMIYGGAGAVVVILIAIGIFFFTANSANSSSSSASSAAAPPSNGVCSDVQTVADEGRAHIQPGETPTYLANPPSSGAHNPDPMPSGIYDSPIDVTREVHSEEHGYVIVHYNGISPDQVQQLVNIVSADSRKIILSPFPNMNFKVTFTAWDHIQTCNSVNAQALKNFISEFRDQGPEQTPM